MSSGAAGGGGGGGGAANGGAVSEPYVPPRADAIEPHEGGPASPDGGVDAPTEVLYSEMYSWFEPEFDESGEDGEGSGSGTADVTIEITARPTPEHGVAPSGSHGLSEGKHATVAPDESETARRGTGPVGGHSSHSGGTPPSTEASTEELAERHWADEFDAVLAQPSTEMSQRVSKAIAIHDLVSSFTDCAADIAKIIVEELPLPPDARRRVPIVNAGGVAGGQKYAWRGIFFKLANDHVGVYGGDAAAAKSASHELRSLKELVTCNVQGLSLPLMATVDYLGHRVVAVAQLPIGRQTLVYGSDDQGRSVVTSDPHLSHLIRTACQRLHLAPHNTGPPGSRVLLYGCCDIEGHRVERSDGTVRHYVVDVARLFPPASPKIKEAYASLSATVLRAPSEAVDTTADATPGGSVADAQPERVQLRNLRSFLKGVLGSAIVRMPLPDGTLFCCNQRDPLVRDLPQNPAATRLAGRPIHSNVVLTRDHGGQLVRLLRPELLRSVGTAVSSDAYSGFGCCAECATGPCSHAAPLLHRVADEVTTELFEGVIPRLAAAVDNCEVVVADGKQLVSELHAVGVNCRYMGALRQQVRTVWVKRLLLIEMVARILRSQLFAQLRRRGSSAVETASQFFNTMFGNCDDSLSAWKSTADAVVVKFVEGVDEAVAGGGALRAAVQPVPCLLRLCDLSGVSFPAARLQAIVDDPTRLNGAAPFGSGEASIEPVCKSVFDSDVVLEVLEESARLSAQHGGRLDFATLYTEFVDSAQPLFGENHRRVLDARLKLAQDALRGGNCDRAREIAHAVLEKWPARWEMGYIHGLCVLGEAYEGIGDGNESIRAYKTALASLKVLAPSHPLLGKVLCSLARSLLHFRRSLDGRATAMMALHEGFAVYEETYGSGPVRLLLPTIITGNAEAIGASLGALCADIREVADHSDAAELGIASKTGVLRCRTCSFENDASAIVCTACDKPLEQIPGDAAAWKCAACTFQNETDSGACMMCGANQRPGGGGHADAGDGSSVLELLAGRSVDAKLAADRARDLLDRTRLSLRLLEDFSGHPRGFFSLGQGSSIPSAGATLLRQSSSTDGTPGLAGPIPDKDGSSVVEAPSSSAGSVCPARCTASSSVLSMTAGEVTSLKVTLQDVSGNPVRISVSALSAEVTGPQRVRCLVTQEAAGVGLVEFSISHAGNYELLVTWNGIVACGGPLSVVVHPREGHRSSCTVTFPSEVRVGAKPSIITAVVRDILGNRRFVEKDDIRVSVRSGSRPSIVSLHPTMVTDELSAAVPVPVAAADPDSHVYSAEVKTDVMTPTVSLDVLYGSMSRRDLMTLARQERVPVLVAEGAKRALCNAVLHMGRGAPAKLCTSCCPPYMQTPPCVRCEGRLLPGTGSAAALCPSCSIRSGSKCVRCMGTIAMGLPAKIAMCCQRCDAGVIAKCCMAKK